MSEAGTASAGLRQRTYAFAFMRSGKSGRFLKCNEATGKWYELDKPSMREKVSHALRSAKDPSRPKPAKISRRSSVKPPSAEEEEAFQQLAAAQSRLFDELVKQDEEEE